MLGVVAALLVQAALQVGSVAPDTGVVARPAARGVGAGRGREATVTPGGAGPVALPTMHSAMAVLAPRAPLIDGRDDDAVWSLAPPITQFLEASPARGRPKVRERRRGWRTTRHNLYVFVRAYDPHPDSIVSSSRDATNLHPVGS